MCLMVYLGSGNERSTAIWDANKPQFFVAKGNPQYPDEKLQTTVIEQVRSKFSKGIIYYAGSREGCGCGFRRDGHWFEDDAELLTKTADNHRNLYDFVSGCLKNEENVEFYAC
jgi:hypothetical protein